MNLLKGIGAGAALGGVLALKYPLVRMYQRRRAKRHRLRRANRTQFSKLPRRKQGAHLSYHRAKLRDKERIYKSGYTKLPRHGVRRRRRF